MGIRAVSVLCAKAIDNNFALRHPHATMNMLTSTKTVETTTGKQETLLTQMPVCGEDRTV